MGGSFETKRSHSFDEDTYMINAGIDIIQNPVRVNNSTGDAIQQNIKVMAVITCDMWLQLNTGSDRRILILTGSFSVNSFISGHIRV